MANEKKATDIDRDSKDVTFYFFDLDNNIMTLPTPILIRNSSTQEVKAVDTEDFAEIRGQFGKEGEWKDFEMFDDSFRHFRDIPKDQLKPGQKQYLIEDIEKAIAKPPETWQSRSWKLFVYACSAQRPLSIITARGHSTKTIKAGIKVLLDHKLIDKEPNYLTIYAVSNPDHERELIDSVDDEKERKRLEQLKSKTSPLKRIAIHNIVDKATEQYGTEPEHRFGMSDDDPMNVDLIVKAMCDMKKKFLHMRFFVIDTHEGEEVKLEVFPVDFSVTRMVEKDECYG